VERAGQPELSSKPDGISLIPAPLLSEPQDENRRFNSPKASRTEQTLLGREVADPVSSPNHAHRTRLLDEREGGV
jgi:hypothetical protein